ncbi:hypothetical protein [Kordiimonas sp. SCSIO 12610]|uniref:hypothetical protein n=1 Tax=Kordiimonas sp. SCSIO 12610 TaxID=2829597 RepID=UPI00210E596B|nr:hypothetical protein [Kordiimonas sp. SCSIO 12610]UTW54203.1 hypothetical protein KFF44_10215 [Kordiimonas sp. SCSIO 12610]
MKQEDIKVPESSKEENASNSSENTATLSDNESTSRKLPVILATVATFAWIMLCAVGLYYYFPQNPEFIDVISIIAASTTPIAIFWLIALAIQRTDPLLERRLAIANNLHKAVAPVEIAENRLRELNKSLNNELANIEAVSELAAERIGNLEGRFQEQISNLFSATADTEAKTTSIRDILARERDHLGTLSSDIERRFLTLEKTVKTISSSLEQAGHSVNSNANTAKSKLDESLQNYSETAEALEERIGNIQQGVENQADQILNAAETVEERLSSINQTVLDSMGDLKEDINGLEHRSNDLTHHMNTQATVLKELAEHAAIESAKIETSLKTHVAEVRTSADEALERTNTVSDIVSNRAQAMSSKVLETVENAKDMLDQASATLEQHCENALATSEALNHKTNEQTKETGAAIKAQAEEFDAILNDSFARAKATLEETSALLSENSAKAVDEAEATAERTLQHIRQLRAGIEDQMHELAEVGASSKDSLIASADQIQEKAANIIEGTSSVNAEFEAAKAQMDDHSDAIAETLNDTRMKLSRLEEDLIAQRHILQTVSDASAEKVIEAAERFMQQSDQIQQASETSSKVIEEQSHDLAKTISLINNAGELTSETLNSSLQTLSSNAELLRTEMVDTGRSLSSASDAFAGERERIQLETEASVAKLNQASDAMNKEASELLQNSVDISNQLDAAAQSLLDQTSRIDENLKASTLNTQEELAATMQDIGDKAGERITFLKEEMHATLNQVLSEYAENAERAEKESALLAMRLGNEATRISETADQFVEKSKEIEERIGSATKNEFARISKLLMESIQSTSIDINKALSTDIPDEVWSKYMEGDRSIFMRRTLKMGDRKTRKVIADKFKVDSEFREAVSRYCRDFENMMERAMLGDKGSVMSVTLLSSDMGKLYILLGQSLKKFS